MLTHNSLLYDSQSMTTNPKGLRQRPYEINHSIEWLASKVSSPCRKLGLSMLLILRSITVSYVRFSNISSIVEGQAIKC